MDINTLEYFLDACEERNITRVAERFFISRQAVSQALLKLEETCGVPLLLRQRDGLVLTPEGEAFYQHCKVIVTQWKMAMDEITAQRKNTRQRLRIGFGQMTFSLWKSGFNNRFQEKNPDIELDVCTGLPDKLFEQLDKGERDLIVTNAPFSSNYYASIPLRKNATKCIARTCDFPSCPAELDPQDLCGRKLLLLRGNSRFNAAFEKFSQQVGIHCEFAYACTDELSGLLREVEATPDAIYLTSGIYSDYMKIPQGLFMAQLKGKNNLQPPQKNTNAVFLKTTLIPDTIKRYVEALRRDEPSLQG